MNSLSCNLLTRNKRMKKKKKRKKKSIFCKKKNLFVVSVPLHVTLVVFSGLRDPQWTINPTDQNYQKIQKLFNEAGNQGFAFLPEQMPPQLGYTGFLVREEGQESAVLILGPKTKQLQQNLLKTVPAGKQIPKDLINEIGKLIEGGRVIPVDIEKSRTKRAAPNYDGAIAAFIKWNNCYKRPRNNCYNYANDKSTSTFAQPGRGSGRPAITRATCTNDLVRNNAISDGLIELVTAPGAPIPVVTDPARHLVALVVAPRKSKRVLKGRS